MCVCVCVYFLCDIYTPFVLTKKKKNTHFWKLFSRKHTSFPCLDVTLIMRKENFFLVWNIIVMVC